MIHTAPLPAVSILLMRRGSNTTYATAILAYIAQFVGLGAIFAGVCRRDLGE